MTTKTPGELKAKFETGKTPTYQDFVDLVDSELHKLLGNFPNPLPAVDGSALLNIGTALPDPLPARDGSLLYNINPQEYNVPAGMPVPSYATATTFVLTGDYTVGAAIVANRVFLIGRRLELTIGGVLTYTEVSDAVFAAGVTTVTLADAMGSNQLTLVKAAVIRPYANGGAVSTGTVGLRGLQQQTLAGGLLLNQLDPAGIDYFLQPSVFGRNVRWYSPGGTMGAVMTVQAGGILTDPAQGSTFISQMHRLRFRPLSSANGAGGVIAALAQCWRGNAAGLGGFRFIIRFGLVSNLNGARAFIGLAALTTPVVAAEPSAALNMIGVGHDAADSSGGNWQLMRNDGAGAATKVDLGAAAARNTSSVFDLYIFCPPNASSITVKIINAETKAIVLADTTYTTDLPDPAVFLSHRAEVGSAATGSQFHELITTGIYLETPS